MTAEIIGTVFLTNVARPCYIVELLYLLDVRSHAPPHSWMLSAGLTNDMGDISHADQSFHGISLRRCVSASASFLIERLDMGGPAG